VSSIVRFAWATLCFNVAVVLWGAFVRATGSGAGCGNQWPGCGGTVLGISVKAQTIIEFTHRMTSVVALLMVTSSCSRAGAQPQKATGRATRRYWLPSFSRRGVCPGTHTSVTWAGRSSCLRPACIGFRFSSGIYRWEFEKGRKALTVNPQGPATLDDPDLVVQAVLNSVGIATTLEQPLSEMIAKGRLVQVLKDWCPTFPGYFLYYPSRRNQPAALAALINTLRLSD